MTAVVTGASGFIGSHLVNVLCSKSEDVICCDNRSKSMLQPSEILEVVQNSKPQVIYHLGGISSTIETNTVEMTQNNILLSCELMEYCIKNNITFVYASSASVYGLGDYGFREDAIPSPLNYYAISKASLDMFVLQKIKDNPSARLFGLRYFNVYGTNEEHKGEQASPVYKFIKQSHEQKEIRIFEGSENFVRDFIHVDDVVNATISAKDFKDSGIYNVGTGQPCSFMSVANIVSRFTNTTVVEIPFPKHLMEKYQKFTCSDNTKISQSGFSTNRVSIEAGIKRVLDG